MIISSVVPDVMHSLTSSVIKYFDRKPLNVGPGCRDRNPHYGSESKGGRRRARIVDAVAAYEMYGGPVLVLDFGTATTYDLISEDGSFEAGITSPGIEISAKALSQTQQSFLKSPLKSHKSILARETISSMQAGLVYGYIGQVEYIVKKVKEEAGLENLKVVATGGLGKIIADETDCIDVYDSQLTLEGLRIIYEKTKRSRG